MKLTTKHLKKMIREVLKESMFHDQEETSMDMEMANKIPEELVSAAASTIDDEFSYGEDVDDEGLMIQAFMRVGLGGQGYDDLMSALYKKAYAKWENEY